MRLYKVLNRVKTLKSKTTIYDTKYPNQPFFSFLSSVLYAYTLPLYIFILHVNTHHILCKTLYFYICCYLKAFCAFTSPFN